MHYYFQLSQLEQIDSEVDIKRGVLNYLIDIGRQCTRWDTRAQHVIATTHSRRRSFYNIIMEQREPFTGTL